ncbi:MAG TPA: DUF2182 domain-containing protein [Steroidobacteraceae bacterium]|nr:DUF2182 domain-containing protein [Steroidobacteraceae bacterium]
MGAMPMPGGGTTTSAWMPMCGQGWIAAGASFLGMWTVMMAAMMLPSLVPMLWQYRRAVGGVRGSRSTLLMLLVAGGYFLVWTLLGAAVYPLGAAATAAAASYPVLAHAAPAATGLVVLIAGLLQLTRWKARLLARCRTHCRREPAHCGRALRADLSGALRHGLRLGFHCSQCCAGLTAVLLVTGVMDAPAMIAVTAAVTLERLAPAGERIARIVGAVVIGAGSLLTARAAGLS